MHTRFQEMSNSIINRLDEMGDRLDDLERSIGDLMSQSGLDQAGMVEDDQVGNEDGNPPDESVRPEK